MKITINQEDLKAAVGCVCKVVPSKTPLDILKNIRLTAGGRGIVLAATDLEIGIQMRVRGEMSKPGSVLLPAKLLKEVVERMPKEPLSITVDTKDVATIVAGSMTTNIHGLSAADYPEMTSEPGGTAAAMFDGGSFTDAVLQVVHAAATTDMRPVLAGVQVVIDADAITLTAADGFRVAMKVVKPAGTPATAATVIVPAKGMRMVAELVTGAPVAMHLQGNGDAAAGPVKAVFISGDTHVTARLTDGTFPDVDKIIPQGYDTRVTLKRTDVVQAAGAARTVAASSSHALKIAVPDTEQPETVWLSTQAAGIGSHESSIHGQIEGAAGAVGLNVAYLLDALGAMTSAEVALEMNKRQPVVLRPVGDTSELVLIMPMTMK